MSLSSVQDTSPLILSVDESSEVSITQAVDAVVDAFQFKVKSVEMSAPFHSRSSHE